MSYSCRREEYTKEWLPQALAIGIREDEFWQMTMRRLNAHVEGFQMRRKMQDEENWMLGMYFMQAIGASMSKKASYPKKPMLQDVKNRPMTEEELQKQRELFVAGLEAMKTNFEISKKNKENGIKSTNPKDKG